MRDKLGIFGKCSGLFISAIGAGLRIAVYKALLPAIVICQGLAVPMQVNSQDYSVPELVFQTDPAGQDIHIAWSGFSPNGKFFALAENVDINVWEVESGKLLHTFKGKPGEKYHTSWSVTFSPDSKLLASGSDGYALRVWDIESGEELKTFAGKDEQVYSIAFSPDGKLLASGGKYKIIRLWEVESGRPITSFAGHDSAVRLIVFSPDGKQLASSSGNKPIKLYDIESGKLLKSFDVDHYSMDFLLKGKVLVIRTYYNTFSFLDVETGQDIKYLNDITRGTHSMIFSPDGKLAAGIKLFGEVGVIRLWDMERGKELQSFEPEPDNNLNSMIFSPDSKVLAINGGKTIRFWDVKSKKLLTSLNGGQDAYFLGRFLPDGKVLGFRWKYKTIYQWDFKSGAEKSLNLF